MKSALTSILTISTNSRGASLFHSLTILFVLILSACTTIKKDGFNLTDHVVMVDGMGELSVYNLVFTHCPESIWILCESKEIHLVGCGINNNRRTSIIVYAIPCRSHMVRSLLDK